MIVQTDLDGAARRDNALAMLAAERELYVLRGRRALLTALLANGTATGPDVRAAVELPPAINPRCFGAVAPPLAKARFIERAAYAATARPEAHARPVGVWRLADRAAAERWLAAHPDRPDHDDQSEAVQSSLW